MATLERAVVTLRIVGDDLVPAMVSELLGALPTSSYVVGETLTSRRGATRVTDTGFWSVEAGATSPADLDAQVLEILQRLTDDLDRWMVLGETCEIDLFCGWFMGAENEGVSLRADTLLALACRGISLSIDLYSPSS